MAGKREAGDRGDAEDRGDEREGRGRDDAEEPYQEYAPERPVRPENRPDAGEPPAKLRPGPQAPAPPRYRPAPDPSDQAIGNHNLYEPDRPGPGTDGSAPDEQVATKASSEVLPVLPLGAGMASIGLGLAFLALRLRRG